MEQKARETRELTDKLRRVQILEAEDGR